MKWHAEIVESNAILEGVPVDLVAALTRLQAAGWTVFQLLPNGVNRWTVICRRGKK
jgi:hypothetical protein